MSGYNSGSSYAGDRNRSSNFSSNRRFNRSSRPSGSHIDVSKFISEAKEGVVPAEYLSKHKFDDFQLSEELKKNIAKRNYSNPTAIQDQAIPLILEGKDVIGVANTGTGKTAAFLIPMINKVLLNRKEQILIITPTRELAVQIDNEFKLFAAGLQMYSVTCIGGMNIRRDMYNLDRKFNFLIGTPGRLKDLITRRSINLSKFNDIILDEADRMVDMGFIQDIKYIISLLPAERQSLFFSATISKDINFLIQQFLRNPVTVSVKSGDTAKNVEQNIVRVRPTEKMTVLQDLLTKEEFKKVLIFGKTKLGVERLSMNLYNKGFKVSSIHGNKSQQKRQQVLNMFKSNSINILIATDVAARGLDISDVSHVINYDLPATYEDYVHRIGRTGRADKKGNALTFIDSW